MLGSSVLVGSSSKINGTFGTSTVSNATLRFIPDDMCVSGRSTSMFNFLARSSTS